MTLGYPMNSAAAKHVARFASILLVAATVVYSVPPASRALAGVRKDAVGSRAGDFALQDVEGKQVSLSEFQGKTVLLAFWGTWCLPCQHELPTIQKIYAQHRDKDMVVLAVDDESKATISKFLSANHYDFTALIDPRRTLFERFAVHYIPTVFVINDKGVIIRKIVGWRGPQELLAAVRASEQ